MKTDTQLQKEVIAQLQWEPLLKASDIGVTAKDGVVTLTGVVDSLIKKCEAEDAVKRVSGVKAVVEKIDIAWSGSAPRFDDADIAKEVVKAFKWDWQVPNDKVTVTVEKGWVTLDGALHWNFQRSAAVKAARKQLGVAGVTNKIVIESISTEAVEQADVESALRRSAAIDDARIQVAVAGHAVTLSGAVGSWYQKEEAERLAWQAPGIWHVHNELLVHYDHS